MIDVDGPIDLYIAQLWLGVASVVVWALVGVRTMQGHRADNRGVVAFTIAFASTLVILVFGSLRLLEVVDDVTWFVIGTGLRAVVALAAVVCLWSLGHARTPSVEEINAEIAVRAAQLLEERDAAVRRLTEAMTENTKLTRRIDERAGRLGDELVGQGQTIIAQGEVQAEASALGADTNETAHRIDDRIPS